MALQSLLLLCALTASGNQQKIDAFDYADDHAARRVWACEPAKLAVRAVKEANRNVLSLSLIHI